MKPSQTATDLYRSYIHSYHPISSKSFERLISMVRMKEVEDGEYLIAISEKANKLFFVVQGILVSEYVTEEGKAVYKNFFVPNNYAASTVSMLLSQPSEFGILALTNGLVLEIDYQEYRRLIHEEDDLKRFYIAYLEKNWVIENERRHMAFATQTADERYLTFLQDYPLLPSQVNQAHIASYLGITPTQLSRIRKKLTG